MVECHHFLTEFKFMVQSQKLANAFYVYGRLFFYVREHWFALVIALIASLLYSSIDAWFVHFIEPLLNKGLVKRDYHFLVTVPALVFGIFLLRSVASFFSNYNIAVVSRNVIMRLRQDIFNKLQQLPARYFDHHTSGQILTLMIYTVEQVANASSESLTTLLQSTFFIGGLIVVMFSISWKLTLLYLISVPIIIPIVRYTSARVRRISLGIQDSVADITHRTEENIEGYKIVRTFGTSRYEAALFNAATADNRQRELKTVAVRSLSVSAVQLVAVGFLVLALYLTTYITKTIISPGSFVSMITAMLAILKPVKDLVNVQNKIYRGLAAGQTIFEMLDEPIEQDLGTKPLKQAKGYIVFKGVSFAYQQPKSVLTDINFTINPGEVVALVGRSGSGKSTLVSLLPRFYDDYVGDILLDNVSIRDYRLADLRRQFAIVTQHVTLFNESIATNIAYGQLEQQDSTAILRAAEAAHATEFIHHLPQGIDSVVGEQGVLLSGGQRQRIALARAILKNAPILILDEATSALDTESERYIQQALEKLMRTKTTLVIAHRLSTIENADKIIVLDQGRLVEAGTHAELLSAGGLYAKWHGLQFKDILSKSAHV